MRPQHGPRQALVDEVIALRRRVEELQRELAGLRGAAQHRRRSEASFKALFERAVCGICRLDAAGRPLFANRAAQALLGYSSWLALEEGTRLGGLFASPAAGRRTLELLDRQCDGWVRALWRHRQGTEVTVHVAGRAVPAADGKRFYEMIVHPDTTAATAWTLARTEQLIGNSGTAGSGPESTLCRHGKDA